MFDNDKTQETLLALAYIGAVLYRSGVSLGLTEAESMTLTSVLVPLVLESPDYLKGL